MPTHQPRSDTAKQRKHSKQSVKYREQRRAEFAEHFRKGFDHGYRMGIEEGLRRSKQSADVKMYTTTDTEIQLPHFADLDE